MRGIFLTFVFLITPIFAQAADLPLGGTCHLSLGDSNGYELGKVLEWREGRAEIRERRDTYSGQVIGLRVHDVGFKFSVFYIDGILGETELVVFSLPDSGTVRYRMGSITYNRLDDGTRVIATIASFEDAICMVVF